MAICIYPQDCADFSTNGLGALTPLSCTVREESCGMFDLELEQPIDETLRWAQLAVGCILKAPVPARESPLYEIEAFEGTEQATTTVKRQLYRVKTNGGRLHLRQRPSTSSPILAKYHQGTEVVKMGDAGGGWFKVVVRDGGAKGYMYSHWLQYVRDISETVTTTRPVTREGITVRQSREQLFRIYSVERDAQEQVVRAKAMHISYDLRDNLVNGAYKVEKKTAARDVLAAIFSKLAVETDFEFHAAPALTAKVSGDYGWKNPIECLLDPDEGVLKQAGALLVRDNFDLYAIPDEPRDSGVTIRRGKNLAGVTVTEDASAVVTRIIPCGKNKKGEDLFLSGTRWVDSPRIGDYPAPRVKKIDYDVKVVDKDADGETTFADATKARARLKALAKADFAENGADLPSLNMDVDFVLLQNAQEYAEYASLQAVFLNDTVTVIDGRIGLKAKLRVTGCEWNALTRQYERISLGDVRSLEQTVYSYNLPAGGVSGSKLAAGSVPGAALRDATIEYAKIAVAAIEQLTADSIVALTARIQEIVANRLTTDELYAALAQLNTAVIENAEIQWADIQSLQAAVAALAKASIGTADIGWAQIKDLITGAAIITEGEAGQLFISRLAVTEANMVSLTTGELVVRGKDGRFYAVTVDEEGNVKTELKQVSNADVTDLSIDAGEKLIEGSVTAACLNATDIFADSAVIRQMIAANLDVDELFAREAFITLLRTSRIVGDKTLEIVVKDAEAAAKAAEAAIAGVDVEYYLSNSPTELSGGKWSTTAPEWVDGKYIWSRTVTTSNSGDVNRSEPSCITGNTGPAGANGKAGAKGETGARGTSILKVTTAPSAYTTQTGGVTPAYRITLANVKAQSGASEVLVGDVVMYSYYHYPVIYTDATYAYTGTRTSIRGATGAAGAKGEQGVGIKSVTNYYLATTSGSGVTTDNPDWTTGVQAMTTTNKYLWNYEVIAYTDGSNSTVDPHIIGVYGNTGAKGAAGAAGKGISGIEEYYALSTSTAAPDDGDFKTAVPTMTATNKYLWNYEKITYTDKTTASTDKRIIGVYGNTGAKGAAGAQGKGVSAIVEEYYLSTSNAKQTGGSWSEKCPAWIAGHYLWTRSKITWTDGATTTTDPVLAEAINAANNAQIGGRNYLPGTGAMTNYSISNATYVGVIKGADGSAIMNFKANPTLAWNTFQVREPIQFSLLRNKQVTISLYARSDDADKIDNTLGSNGGGMLVELLLMDGTSYTRRQYRDQIRYPKLTTEWQRYSATVTLTDDYFSTNAGAIVVDDSTRFTVAVFNRSLYRMQVKQLKLELGSKATDHTLAPEDVEGQIDNVAGQVGDVNSRVDDCVTHAEQEVYLRLVSGLADYNGVYVGYQDAPAQALIDASGWFRVMYNGKSIASLGPRIQELGTLMIYESADGGHAFI